MAQTLSPTFFKTIFDILKWFLQNMHLDWTQNIALLVVPQQRYTHLQKQRWSPRGRPWPRGHILKSLALASKPQVLSLGLEALGPRKLLCPRLEDSTIFEPLKFCWKTPETSRKICNYFFGFPQLEHRLSQAGLLSPVEISPMTKM